MKCIDYWPEDGRSYVALGKVLIKQSKTSEARAVYEKGSQATQGENPYIWQVRFMFQCSTQLLWLSLALNCSTLFSD